MSQLTEEKKTLSERLAELANPTPQFADPEDEYNQESKARLESFDDEYESKDTGPKKKLKSQTSLRQKNAEILANSDIRYAGKRISRKELEEVDDDDDNDDEIISEESEDENYDDINDILAFKNKFMQATKTKPNKSTPEEYEDDNSLINTEEESQESGVSESEQDDELSEEEEAEDESFGGEGEEEEDGLEAMDHGEDEESENIDDSEENTDVKLTKNSQQNDAIKGKSIQNQLSLWDHLLECRIKLHKGINLSNQLPQAPSTYKLFSKISESGENHFVLAGQGAKESIKSLLDSCLELQDLYLKSNPQTKSILKRKSSGAEEVDMGEEIPSDTDEEAAQDEEESEDEIPRRKKLKIAEYETEIGRRHESYRPFCLRTLNLWSEKTRLATGKTGSAGKSGFGAFDQSILKQIEGILADKQRLINRTRIKRSNYRVLGCPMNVENTGKPTEKDEIKDDLAPADRNQTNSEELDPEIYDDDDFYHQLLRELIEKKTGEAGTNQTALGRQWLEIQKLRSKAKRKVDSKASKGRRLRYQVHPKLVSFMAPYPETSWNDIAKNELFASLFGSGT